MRWNVRVALGRQCFAPRPEICATHTSLFEPHADWLEVEVAAPDPIEPRTCARLHLMGVRLPFGSPGLRQWRIFREAALITEQHAGFACSFLRQMRLDRDVCLLKPLGVSFF